MRPPDDAELLTEYVTRNSEDAFTALVERHVALVYSAGLRQVGEPHLAEEVTQLVFTILARKARGVSHYSTISGWLCRVAWLVSRDVLRTERRRRHRELVAARMENAPDSAWMQIAPLLDEIMARLGEKDRNAIVLRFYEQKSLGEIGAALGVDADAAQKRVSRALEKLRKSLAKHGVASTTAAIGGAISANSIQAAPPALAGLAASTALVNGVIVGGSTLIAAKGALKVMAWTKAKSTVAGLLVAACLIVPFIIQHQSRAAARETDEALRQQAEQLAKLRAEHDRLSSVARDLTLSKSQLDDLGKLRAEVGTLRQQAAEVARLKEQNRQLAAKTGRGNPMTPVQIKEAAMARMSYGKNWVIGFYQYSQTHGGRFPASFDEAAAFAPDSVKKQTDITTDQFEIVFQGLPSSLQKPGDVILFREREAWDAGETSHSGKSAKIYTFADGHTEIHHEAENDFSAYEQQHIIAPPSGDQ